MFKAIDTATGLFRRLGFAVTASALILTTVPSHADTNFERNTLRHWAIRRPHQAPMPRLGVFGRLIPARAVFILKTMQIWSRMLV
ncbi:MAG: hypothetical protein RI979_1941 [Pseudomonadota bacterium]